jgi:hypothetical protein
MTGESIDNGGVQRRPVRRNQQWPFLAMKVVRDNEMARLIGNDQISPDPLEIARKQKMGIGNREGFRIFPMREPTEVHITGRTLAGPTSPKFTGVFHDATQKINKILINIIAIIISVAGEELRFGRGLPFADYRY